ncbi:MAG: hypothetical protein QGF94_04610 [Candidatus Thalassarchaeaceae archaeon]|jgi:thiol-disulfide isomerase/thioredoxin|nr:hypothetical protein [Candidatus Thalassarchaeaceae archaeon]
MGRIFPAITFVGMILIASMPVSGSGIIDIESQEDEAIIFAIEVPLDGGEIRHIDHVVELFTATWCLPCRTAEIAAEGLSDSHTNTTVVKLHSSNISDEQFIQSARERMIHAGVDGYPTFAVDGQWRLISRAQANEVDDLLDALPDSLGTITLQGNATKSGGIIQVELNSTEVDVELDLWVIDEEKENLAIAGEFNQTWDGTSQTWAIAVNNGTEMIEADYVLIIGRTPGNVELMDASNTFPTDQTIPTNDEANGRLALFVGILIFLLMAPAMMTTVQRLPSLLNIKSNEEE